MKIRDGFVSNSSSSSFVVPLDKLTWDQIHKLCAFTGDGWGIYIDGEDLHGFTDMDNGALGDFMEEIGVNQTRIQIVSD